MIWCKLDFFLKVATSLTQIDYDAKLLFDSIDQEMTFTFKIENLKSITYKKMGSQLIKTAEDAKSFIVEFASLESFKRILTKKIPFRYGYNTQLIYIKSTSKEAVALLMLLEKSLHFSYKTNITLSKKGLLTYHLLKPRVRLRGASK